jgi:hypothetical protein
MFAHKILIAVGLILASMVFMGCEKKLTQTGTSKLILKFAKKNKIEPTSSGLHTSGFPATGKICYAMNILASDIAQSEQNCFGPLGIFAGFVQENSTLSADVPLGFARTIDIYAFYDQSNSVSCPSSLSSFKPYKLFYVGSKSGVNLEEVKTAVAVSISFPGQDHSLYIDKQMPLSCLQPTIPTPPTVNVAATANATELTAFPVAVVCPSDAVSVDLSVNSGTAQSFNCTNGSLSSTIDISSFSDGTLSLVVSAVFPMPGMTTNPDRTSVNVLKDTSVTTAPSAVTDATYYGSLIQTPPITYTAAADSLSGIDHYQAQVLRSSDSSTILDWTNHISGNPVIGVVLSDATSYYVKIRAVDVAGNTSTAAQSDGWVVHASGPTTSGMAFNDGVSDWSTSKTPTFTWNAATDVSGVSNYEISIGTLPGGTQTMNWTSVALSTSYQFTGLNLVRGTAYYANIRAYNNVGLVSTVQGDGWYVLSEMWVPNGEVNAVVSTASTVYVGGNFTAISEWSGGGVPLNSSTGTKSWPNASARARVSGTVYVAVTDGTGGFYIGGNFNAVGGVVRNNLAHIHVDGTLDLNWNPNANNSIYSMVLNSTNLYVGGDFTTIGGSSRVRLASFNISTGSLTSWAPVANNTVLALALDATTLYVGGNFADINSGTVRHYLASFAIANGSLNSWDPDANGQVRTLLLNGTSLYAGGDFDSMNGGANSRKYLASFDTSTGNLSTWDPVANARVIALAANATTLFVGGEFTTLSFGGADLRNRLASYDLATGNLNSWDPNANLSVKSIALNNSTLYVGGDFTTMGTSNLRNRLASFNLSNGALTSWNPNTNNNVYALALYGSTLYAGGDFTIMNTGTTRNNLASFNLVSGGLSSWDPNANDMVTALAINGTTLYVGGGFTSISSEVRNYLASFSLATGSLTSWNPSAENIVSAIALNASTIYAGGDFTTLNGGADTRNHLASFDISTGSLNSWNPNVDNNVKALALDATNLYIGGIFANIGATPRNRLASFDVTTGILTTWNPNADNGVKALALNGTTLYAGGSFTYMNVTTPRNYLASFDISNGNLSNWNPNADGSVSSLAIDSTSLYVGGGFTTLNGGASTRKRLASFNLSTGSLTSWDPIANNTVSSLALNGSILFIGGAFTSVGLGPAYLAPIEITTGSWLPGH